jgi:hypothetical protein
MQRFVRIFPNTPVRTLSATHRPFPKHFGTMTGAAKTDIQAAVVANASGITSGSLQSTLREKLQAEHVDVEDISGMSILPPRHTYLPIPTRKSFTTNAVADTISLRRWLRSII